MKNEMTQDDYKTLYYLVEQNRNEELDVSRIRENLRSGIAKSCVERAFGGCIESAMQFIQENTESVRHFDIEARVIDGYASTELVLRPGEAPDYENVMNALRENEFASDLEYEYNEDLLKDDRAIIRPRLKPFNECVFKEATA